VALVATSSFGESDDQLPDEVPLPSDLEERVEIREPLPRGEDPAAFQTRLSTEEINSRGQDLADILRRVPGAHVRDYGGLGSYATISLRASTSEQVTVLVDGVPQNRALGGAVDLSSIPATQVEEINVFRGFGPADLGLGGVGGVIDVRTKPVGSSPAVQGQVDLLGGSLETGRLAAAVSIPTGEARGLRLDAEAMTSAGSYFFLDTGGTYFNSSDDQVRRRENNGLEQTALRLQHAWDRIGRDRVRVALNLQDRERGVPWIDNLPTGSARLTDRRGDFTTSWVRSGQGRTDDVEVVLNAFGTESRFADPDADFGIATDRITEMEGVGLAGVWRGSLGLHRVTARADLRRERAAVRDLLLSIDDRGGGERSWLGLTVEDVVTTGRWTVSPSLRWDYRADEFVEGGGGTLPPPAEDVTEGAGSGKIGVAWAAGPRTSVRGSVGTFHRPPSLLELFGNRGALRGNPTLRPERASSAELGVAHVTETAGPRLDVELVGFGRRTRDMIHFRQQSQGVAVAVNLLETEVFGFEGMGGVGLRNGLRFDFSVTWQRATDRSGGPFDGKPLIFHPEWLGYTGLRWQRGGWRTAWELTYVGENSADEFDTPELRLPARLIHDVVVGYDFASGLRLSLDVRNLLDRRTVDVARYPLPDRVVLLHVGWNSGARKR
jgi:iron complex outermembrane receptor protein